MTTARLKHKIAIVTGGDTGIGKAISLAMAREGASVVIDYHGAAKPAKALVAQIKRLGARAVAVGADVSIPADVDTLIKAAVDAFGGLDIMVNNAGIEKKTTFVETPFEQFQKIIDVNLGGAWLCSQAAAKQMMRQKRGGRIVNISSVHEELAMPGNAPYCASKGAIRMLTRTIALELAPENITVNNVAPGAVDTPMDAPLKKRPKKMATLLDEIPLHRMARPEEIAKLVCFLASEDAAYVTGATYVIDGGMTKSAGSL